jgi:hypothetical protein
VVGADQVDETQVVLRVSLLSKGLSTDSKLTCSL